MRGILLLNLGTPDAATKPAVRRYLREFLQDKRVIDIPAVFRWLLVNAIIIPFRITKSTLAYQKIWDDDKSPLLKNMQDLTIALQAKVGADYRVDFAMRYGNPAIETVLEKFADCDELKILPLYPQYTSAASGSAVEMTLHHLMQRWNIPSIQLQADFFADPGFIKAYAAIIKHALNDKPYDILLFSYHGLPERHITKSGCAAACDHLHACPAISAANRFCYRAQCYATTRLIAQELGLNNEQYQVAFQSRLGKTPWIKPYTDLLLPELITQGVKNIAIVCPSFVSDCLETLEEVNIRTRQQWQALGGQDFTFIPCLNTSPDWIDALAELALQS